MQRFPFLERVDAVWHRFKAVPLALQSPIPPVDSPLFPKGPTAWASTIFYNSPGIDLSPNTGLIAFQPGHVLTLGGDQYRIHRKLRGQATSTVWLAEHAVRGASRRRFVALETFDSIFSSATARQVRAEPRSPTTDLNYIRNIIAAQDRGLSGAEHCDRLRAVFLPDRHLYAIKDPTGPTVWDLQIAQPDHRFSLEVTKRIIRDTLRALQYVHSFGRAAVGVAAHNLLVAQPNSNDALSANIARFLQTHPPETKDPSTDGHGKKTSPASTSTSTSTSPSDQSSPSSNGKNTTPPFKPPAPKSSTTPKRKNLTAVLKSQPLPAFGLSPTFDNIQVRLTRCEHATLETRLRENAARDAARDPDGKTPPRLTDYYHSEPRLCPPEALHGAPERWAPPVNIWAVGHLVFQFLTGHYVYTANANPDPNGPALPVWPELVFLCRPRTRFLEQRLRRSLGAPAEGGGGAPPSPNPNPNPTMSDADVRATCAFVGRCWALDPAQRATAAELLEDAWFRT